jgi:hypothetical protein
MSAGDQVEGLLLSTDSPLTPAQLLRCVALRCAVQPFSDRRDWDTERVLKTAGRFEAWLRGSGETETMAAAQSPALAPWVCGTCGLLAPLGQPSKPERKPSQWPHLNCGVPCPGVVVRGAGAMAQEDRRDSFSPTRIMEDADRQKES